jgi:hypothetical protein
VTADLPPPRPPPGPPPPPPPPPRQDAMDDKYQSVLGENYAKWFGPKVV